MVARNSILRLLPLGLLWLSGCASTPDTPRAVTAMRCQDFDDAPDVGRLGWAEHDDFENWTRVTDRQSAVASGTARWSTSTTLAFEIEPDGSVSRVCVAEASDLTDLDRSWLEAIAIARFRMDRVDAGWLRFRGSRSG